MLHEYGTVSGHNSYLEIRMRTEDLSVPSGGDLWAEDIPVSREMVRDRLWRVGR